jgi:alpha-glucoside transport system permease protein
MTAVAPPASTQIATADAGSEPHVPAGARLRRVLRKVPVNVTLAVLAALWIIPALGLLITSFRPVNDYLVSGWWQGLVHPTTLTMSNYKNVIQNAGIGDALVTTVLITVPTTLLVVIIAALAGYSLVFQSWPGRDWVFLGIVALLVVPLQMALLPISSLFGNLGLYGNIPGVVIFHTAFGLPFAIFLMRNFYTGIPKDLLEAARIDGASEWVMFLKIVLPLGRPALASLAIFEFLWVWNDLLVALVFLAPSSHQPLTVAIFSQLRQFGSNIDIIAVASFISLIVPLIVFLAFQRQFVRGVLAGAVK